MQNNLIAKKSIVQCDLHGQHGGEIKGHGVVWGEDIFLKAINQVDRIGLAVSD
jgi:hypothetical protein